MNFAGAWRAVLAVGLVTSLHANADTFDTSLAGIQDEWAVANYEATGDARTQRLATLSGRAHTFVVDNPSRAEPLIWEGIVLSTYAGAKGGLAALGLAKKSRAALEAAMKIDPLALDGSAYTSLGALYSKVPGFPLSFGNDAKAEEFLLKALELNPNGADPNYFYAQYLCDRDRCDARARRYLERAESAPARPGREMADMGRHREVVELMGKLK